MKLKLILTIAFIIFILPLASIAQDESFSDAEQDIFQPEEYIQPQVLIPAFEPLQLNPSETIYKQVTTRFNTLDPAYSAGYYPGGRGPNQLIIYTKNFGLHTGTNEFGTEAIVQDNTVTSLSGADSVIPENGLVISGHGQAKNWINQNITIGSKVYVNQITNTITVYTTSESYSYEAKAKIAEAQDIINYYKSSLVGYNPSFALNHIQSAQNYLQLAENEKQNSIVLKQYTKEAIDQANMAIKTSLPYVAQELKGVWLRPTEKTEEQIIATLDRLKDNGFNSVFLETYYHGKTIFPSRTMNKYGFTVQNEDFVGFNPLEIWVKEGHKRGIKIHTWFQSFYVGNKSPMLDSSSILAVHPEWGNKTKRYADSVGPTMSQAEHNGYFLDPANPEVQEFLQELVSEIITDYCPDGINLDYIRYPNANARSDMAAWGFSTYAREEFKSIYGVDPVDINISDVQWYDWNEYRRRKVTEFVRKIGELGRLNRTYISAVIFPDLASALASKQQDWRTWSFQNYIDGFTPIFLTYDSNMLSSMMRDVMGVKSPETELYAGLFVTFMGGASEDLIRQIYETRKMKANGVILFDYAHTTPVYTSTLMESVFNSVGKTSGPVIAQKKKLRKEKKDKPKRAKKTKAKEKQS